MLHSARTLHAEAAWAALEADDASARDGLPNRACPSDHLPVGACFLVTPTLTLARTLTLTQVLAFKESMPSPAADASRLVLLTSYFLLLAFHSLLLTSDLYF